MKRNVVFCKKPLSFPDFLQRIQMEQDSLFQFLVGFGYGTAERRSPQLFAERRPFVSFPAKFKGDNNVPTLFHAHYDVHFTTGPSKRKKPDGLIFLNKDAESASFFSPNRYNQTYSGKSSLGPL
jgi:hypothetical protein